MSDYKDGISDRWSFQKDSAGEWRWGPLRKRKKLYAKALSPVSCLL